MKQTLSRSLVLGLTLLATSPAAFSSDPETDTEDYKAQRIALLKDCEVQNKGLKEFSEILEDGIRLCEKALKIDLTSSSADRHTMKLAMQMNEMNSLVQNYQSEAEVKRREESVRLRSKISDKRLKKLIDKCEKKNDEYFKKRQAQLKRFGECKIKIVAKNNAAQKQQSQSERTEKNGESSGSFGGVDNGYGSTDAGFGGTSGTIEKK